MTAADLDELAALARAAWSEIYGSPCVPWERATERSKKAWRAAVRVIQGGNNVR